MIFEKLRSDVCNIIGLITGVRCVLPFGFWVLSTQQSSRIIGSKICPLVLDPGLLKRRQLTRELKGIRAVTQRARRQPSNFSRQLFMWIFQSIVMQDLQLDFFADWTPDLYRDFFVLRIVVRRRGQNHGKKSSIWAPSDQKKSSPL